MGKASDYQSKAKKMEWPHLADLWDQIGKGQTDGWPPGKALEYLVIRGYQLSGLEAEYPYDVRTETGTMEQIDGLVYWENIPFLVECKDQDHVDATPLYKLHAQINRRPPMAMGCIFVSGNFTDPAVLLADYLVPRRIILWTKDDITTAVASQSFVELLEKKYKDLCMYGLTNYSPTHNACEIED